MNEYNKNKIYNKLPKDFHISFENIIHKNNIFNPSIVIAIPYGKKCLIWINNKQYPSILFIYKSSNGRGCHIFDDIIPIHISSFIPEEIYGTILYGTIIDTLLNNATATIGNNLTNKIIAIEDVVYYKYNNISHYYFNKKLNILSNIIKHIDSKGDVLVGLCVMSKSSEELIEKQIPYKCKYFNYRFFNSPKKSYHTFIGIPKLLMPTTTTSIKTTTIMPSSNAPLLQTPSSQIPYHHKWNRDIKQNTIFKIKATPKDDIYELYDKNNKYIDIAFIPDYKTSVFMNSIFRNIKENKNLDLLEESDNEDEEHNELVYLDKEINMVCEYNKKFNKWKPIHTI